MPNPRDVVAFDDIGKVCATFKIDDSTIVYSATAANGSPQAGLAVELSADDTVALVNDQNAVLGKLLAVAPDKKAIVQIAGFCKLPGGSGATLTRGSKIVGDLGPSSARGYIQVHDTATAAQAAKARGIMTNVGDAANVIVWLG